MPWCVYELRNYPRTERNHHNKERAMKIVDGRKRGRPGCWIVDYYDEENKRRTPSFPTLELAESFQRREENRLNALNGVLIDVRIALDEFFTEHYIPALEREAIRDPVHGVDPGSIAVYKDMYRLHIYPYFYDRIQTVALRKIDAKHIRMFAEHLKEKVALAHTGKPVRSGKLLKQATINKILRIVSSIFSHAMATGLRPDNPVSGIWDITDHAKERKHVPYGDGLTQVKPLEPGMALNRTERDRVLLAAFMVLEYVYYLFILLLAFSGMRPSEAIALKWEHCDLKGLWLGDGVPRIKVERTYKRRRKAYGRPKSHHTRFVVLDPAIAALLIAYQELRQAGPKDWVFSGEDGRPLPLTPFSNLWAEILALAAVPRWLPLYCLRHTYASLLLVDGESATFVCRQLGHHSVAFTEKRYGWWLQHRTMGALSRLHLNSPIRPPDLRTIPTASRTPCDGVAQLVPPCTMACSMIMGKLPDQLK